MAILLDASSRIIVQGITGAEGTFHGNQCHEYGGNVVGGVTPGKGGQTALDSNVPVFNSCAQARDATGANVSLIFVPAPFAGRCRDGSSGCGDRADRLHHRRNSRG